MRCGGLEAGFIQCPTPNSVAQLMPYRETRWHLTLTRSRFHPEYGGIGRWVGLMVLGRIIGNMFPKVYC
jgi:hypothetical protein